MDAGNESLQVFAAQRHGQDGRGRDGRLYLHLVGIISVDKVGFEYAVLEDGQSACRYPLVVEIAGTEGFDNVRLVRQRDVAACNLFTEFVQQEGIVLLNGRAVERIDKRREHAAANGIVQQHGIFAGGCFPLPHLAQDTLQGFRPDAALYEGVVKDRGIVVVGFRTGFAFAPDADASGKGIFGV
ncbi:hypothetical protein Barb7_02919 [Bacteroidales bacterium Barb7]|nr:hypothetical protein Barb7_02919 [Bacteroidales bacterium Barb7]